METMKDTQRSKVPPMPNATRALTPDDIGIGFAVKELRFCVVGGRDLPFDGSNGGFGMLVTKARIEITWHPKIHMYRCVERGANSHFPDRIVFVPDAWATCELS